MTTTRKTRLTFDEIRAIPKPDLHCHLDGSLRIGTLLELARKQKIQLPADSEEGMQKIIHKATSSRNLTEYLRTFDFTLAVMQDEENIARIATELCEDAWEDGVWYMEVRFSPILHQQKGLTLTHVMEAVLKGLREGERKTGIRTGVIICGIRQIEPSVSLRLAELTVAYKGRGVVGFDLAGIEDHYPAKDHADAFYLIRTNNVPCTVHAGEAWGPASIKQALHDLNAHRIGHGTRLVEDGDLLNYMNNHRIPLECCVSSNVHVGAAASVETHPIRFYYDYGLRVTVNTDNRLMSQTSISKEYDILQKRLGFTRVELEDILIMGFKSAFLPYAERKELLARVLDAIHRPHLPF
ncbi:MAG TPA: adenosine deaminase [Bacteroidetes bacterium]|nr:adenosine deaminase [Bacteroidota bacterium]